MGDGFVVEAFCQHMRQPVADWQTHARIADDCAKLCYARDPVTKKVSDLSFTGYADDLCKKVLVTSGSFEDMVNKTKATSKRLADSTADFGYAQNLEKEVTLPVLIGGGSHA